MNLPPTDWATITIAAILMVAMSISAAEPPLQPCPDSPNCVSSLSKDSSRIEPFSIKGDEKAAIARLHQILAGRDDAKIINASETSISVEFHTTLGFVDDAIFVIDKTANVIQVRSASRSGYWDLGKNRHRLEAIRLKFLGGE